MIRYRIIVSNDPEARVGTLGPNDDTSAYYVFKEELDGGITRYSYDYTVYDSSRVENTVISAQITKGANEFGRLTYTYISGTGEPGNLYIGPCTTAYVYRDDSIVFVGRLSNYTENLTHERTVVFEDIMAVLDDCVLDEWGAIGGTGFLYSELFDSIVKDIDFVAFRLNQDGADDARYTNPFNRRFNQWVADDTSPEYRINEIPYELVPKLAPGFRTGAVPLNRRTSWQILNDVVLAKFNGVIYSTCFELRALPSLPLRRYNFINFRLINNSHIDGSVDISNVLRYEKVFDCSTVRSVVYAYSPGGSVHKVDEQISGAFGPNTSLLPDAVLRASGLRSEVIEFNYDMLPGVTDEHKINYIKGESERYLTNNSTPSQSTEIEFYPGDKLYNVGDIIEVVRPDMRESGVCCSINYDLLNPGRDIVSIGSSISTLTTNVKKADRAILSKIDSNDSVALKTMAKTVEHRLNHGESGTYSITLDSLSILGYKCIKSMIGDMTIERVGSDGSLTPATIAAVKAVNVDYCYLDGNTIKYGLSNNATSTNVKLTVPVCLILRKVE